MKHHLHQLVDIDKLRQFLADIKFPISDSQLEKQAKKQGADKSVIDFLEAIDEAITYQQVSEVITHAEEVNLLRAEETESPPEQFSIDEY